ncbi:hypothetical protein CDD80_1167 [Ophiocordyceps camponoti-rufipedis]|uniref:Uncharacterized protein n=1 Tax=Ophiocordyceps camponoti-rufipedis TaxID=2004952 RepID=A0A2C5YAS2_9HYPO|nr:hypothetical protein CDD80_1167 [Ophiocordyceps camponoti-rufipedis]
MTIPLILKIGVTDRPGESIVHLHQSESKGPHSPIKPQTRSLNRAPKSNPQDPHPSVTPPSPPSTKQTKTPSQNHPIRVSPQHQSNSSPSTPIHPAAAPSAFDMACPTRLLLVRALIHVSAETGLDEKPLKKRGVIVLHPQPTDDNNDPLNWSWKWKLSHFLLLTIGISLTNA